MLYLKPPRHISTLPEMCTGADVASLAISCSIYIPLPGFIAGER